MKLYLSTSSSADLKKRISFLGELQGGLFSGINLEIDFCNRHVTVGSDPATRFCVILILFLTWELRTADKDESFLALSVPPC